MENCPICLEEIEIETVAITTVCNHRFCEVCLTRWLETHYNCPMCREQLREEPEEDADYDPDDDAELPAEYVALVRNVVISVWRNYNNRIFQGLMPLLENDALRQQRVENNRIMMRERIDRNIERAHIEQEARIMRRQQEAEEEHIRRNQNNH